MTLSEIKITDFIRNMAVGGSMHLIRYFLVAGIGYVIFYVVFKNRWIHKKIQSAFPQGSQINREIWASLGSILMFTLFFGISMLLYYSGYSKIYKGFSEHSIAYFLFSIVVLIAWHDTYFYWTHRLLHLKAFSRFHRLHHRSHNTTPWTSFAFHPVEAAIQAAFVPIIIVLLPLHAYAIAFVLTWQMVFNVMGHLGYEVFPVWFHKTWVGKLFNTSTHHNMHHQYAGANYGLYFNLWDRLMKTNHALYEEKFKEASRKMYTSDKPIEVEHTVSLHPKI